MFPALLTVREVARLLKANVLSSSGIGACCSAALALFLGRERHPSDEGEGRAGGLRVLQEPVHDALDGREKVGHLLEAPANGSRCPGLADEAVVAWRAGSNSHRFRSPRMRKNMVQTSGSVT